MKNGKSGFYVAFVILLVTITVCNCNGMNGDNGGRKVRSDIIWIAAGLPELDAATEAQIKQDLQAEYGESLAAVHYLGTYNGYVTIRVIPYAIRLVVTNFKIAGTIFKGTDIRIRFWKDGTIYYDGMSKLYLQGELTSDDISKIGENFIKIIKESFESESSFNEWYERYLNSDDISQVIE